MAINFKKHSKETFYISIAEKGLSQWMLSKIIKTKKLEEGMCCNSNAGIPYLPLDLECLRSDMQRINTNPIGVDVPVWVRSCSKVSEGHERPVLVIVGMAPQRNAADATRNMPVLIGTPYAAHHVQYRRKTNNKYWPIFRRLITKGYDLYLTDVYKIYANKYVYGYDMNSFVKEVNSVRPSGIVTFGNDAARIFGFHGKLNAVRLVGRNKDPVVIFGSDIPVIPMLHPNPRYSAKHMDKFFTNNKTYSGKTHVKYAALIHRYMKPYLMK